MGAKEGQRKGVKEIIFYAYLIQSVSTPFPMFVIKYPEKKSTPKRKCFFWLIMAEKAWQPQQVAGCYIASRVPMESGSRL